MKVRYSFPLFASLLFSAFSVLQSEVTKAQCITLTDSSTAATCWSNSGELMVEAAGGVPPLTYAWSDGITDTTDGSGQWDEWIVNAPGTYCVTVTDVNACTASGCYSIVAIPGPTITGTTTNATCGQGNGSIDITVTGGSAPYSFTWNNGVSIPDLNFVFPSTYDVTIMDANGCTTTQSFTVGNDNTMIAVLMVETSDTADIYNLNVTVLSGTPPYVYAWSNGATDSVLYDLVAGTYGVTITDVNGCSGADDYPVGSNCSYDMSFTYSLSGNTVTATVTNPNGSLAYTWMTNNDAQTYSGDQVSYNIGTTTNQILCLSATNGSCEQNACESLDLSSYVVDTVSGKVWQDYNGDGVQDAGEPALAYTKVKWINTGDTSVHGSFLTGANGLYNFALLPGTYDLSAQYNYGYYVQSFPASLGVYSITVAGNQNQPDNDFGFQPTHLPVTGHLFYDVNENGTEDAGDYALAGHQIHITPGITVWTNANGDFTFYGTLNDVYTITANQGGWTVTTSPTSYNFTLTVPIDSVNFGVVGPPPTIGLQTSVCHTWAACFTPKLFNVHVHNSGTVFIDTGYVKFWWPNETPLDSAYPAPDLMVGDTLYWYYSNLNIGQSKTFKAWLYIPGPGIVLDAYAFSYGSYTAGSIDGFSQGFNHDIVTCAFDPNEKEANADSIETLNTPIDYTIRFQNTGTDSAHNIIVRDTLSNLLDWNTFSLVSSTHDVNVQLDPMNGALAFIFDNIFLPDSNVNEPASHGQVDYRVSALSTLPLGTVFHNTASIYFDANPPIVTNDALVTYALATGINEIASANVSVYPNPATDQTRFQIKSSTTMPTFVSIRNVLGREVATLEVDKNGFATLDRNKLPAGVYTYRVVSNGGFAAQGKFVLE